MSHRTPAWLSLTLVVVLLVQAALPAFAPPVAFATDEAPPNVTVTPELALPAFPATTVPVTTTVAFTPTLPSPPTAAPAPAATARNLNLDLSLDPPWAAPGDVVTFTVSACNPDVGLLPALTLTDTLPDGLVYVAHSGQGFAYDADAKRLTWAAGDLAAGMIITGSFQARAQGLMLGATVTNAVIASSPALVGVVTADTALDIVSPRNNEAWATPGEGGQLRSADDRLLLRVPPGAVTRRTHFTYAAQDTLPLPLTGLRYAFTVEAQGEGGQTQHEFAAALELTLAYRPGEFLAGGGAPALYTFDETAGRWAALPTAVDRARRQLRVAVPHLTLFAAATGAFSYGAQDLPTVHAFASDEWSGNGSARYPLTLPPGPGGLGLDLALVYSSEGVNGVRQPSGDGRNDEAKAKSFDRQASIIGWGWSLAGLGQVTVQGAPEQQGSSNRFWLSFAGGSYELKYINGGWQTEPQGFLRIEHAGSSGAELAPWYVWTPDGAKYTFGGATGIAAGWHPHADGTCGQHARELHLTEVRDPHGNVMTVTYAVETESVTCASNSTTYQRAIRPVRVEYFPIGQPATVRVDFAYLQDRQDLGVSSSEPFYTNYRLATITVGVRTGSAAAGFTTARSYALTNMTYATDQWGNKRLMLLTGITAKGRDGGARPAWTFTYVQPRGSDWFNHTLLVTADNGQGGKATYTYEDSGNIYIGLCSGNTVRYRVQQMTVEDGQGSGTYNKIQTTYAYGAGFSWADSSDYPTCAKNWEFGGYALVQRSIKDGAGAVAQVVENSYHQCGSASPAQACKPNDPNRNETKDARRGKMYLSLTSSTAGSGELARTATTWSAQTLNGTPWVYEADSTQTQGSATQKTAYEYQTAQQGGTQYGNMTHVKTYSDGGATLYRTQVTVYYPRNDTGSAYIVNRPAQQVLWDAAGACQGETRIWYDANTAYNQAPTKGDAAKTQVAQTSCGGTWGETGYTYDAWGNQIGVTDPRGNLTTTAYDTTAGSWPMLYTLPTSMTAPLIGTTSYVWDKVLAQVTGVTDPNAAVTNYTYDQWGRQLKLIKPGDDTNNSTVKFSYTDYAGASAPYWVKQEQRESGANYLESRTYYDGLGRVVQTQAEAESSSQSIITSTRYNPLGAVQITTPYTHTAGLGVGGDYRPPDWQQPSTQTVYDALGRVTLVINPDGTLTETRYAVEVNAADPDFSIPRLSTYTIDANRHFVRRASDVFGNLRSVSESTGSWPVGQANPTWGSEYRTRYTYDVAGQLRTVQDHALNQTTLTYDLMGRKTAMTDPDMGAWSYAYDAAGNLKRQTDAKNQTTCFYYDGLNRLKGKTYRSDTNCPVTDPGSYTVTYGYDAGTNSKGRRTSLSDGSGSASWTYDARGRVAQETKVVSGTGGGTFVTQWDYDAADRPVWQKYPGGNASQSGEQVNYTYTYQGLLNTVSGMATYVSASQYNVQGQLAQRILGTTTPVRLTYGYTAAENFRLVSLQAGVSPTYTNLQTLSYTYDDVGNVLTITDAAAYGGSQMQTFTYDALDRLSAAQASGTPPNYGAYSQKGYGYDAIGNLTSFEASVLTYQDTAHKHAVTHVGGVQKYWYDQNGNATRRINGTHDVTLSYDAENRLTGLSGGVTASYIYDGDGQRVKETAGSVTTVYIGNYYEWTGITTTMKSYYYAGGTRIALRTGASTGTVNYLLGDHLGSQALTLTSAGGRLATNTELRYMPYGVARYTAGTTPTSFNFTGQRKDSGSGLLFYNARWYDPYLNRWIQPDTIIPNPGDPQSLNRYSYAANNPVKYRDPSGHIPCYGDGPDECSWAGYKDQPAGARRHSLRRYARFLEKQVQKDGITALDAMTDLWGFASLYGKDAVMTSDDVSYTLVGSGGTLTLLSGFLLKGQEFLGGAPLNLVNFGDTGFNPNYRDGHNQPYHFWANVNTTAQGGNLGQGIGLVANVVHEMADPSEALKAPQERGTSWEDYFLSLKGLEMGQMLRSGALTVDQAGSWMQANLSAPAGPGYDFWKSTGTGWWPSVWMQHAVDLFR